MNTFKWIPEGFKSLWISKSFVGSQGVQARFLGSVIEVPLPPKPKRPLTPFVKYKIVVQKDVKKQHPRFDAIDLQKVVAEKWSQLPETEKALYSQNFQTEMSNYRKEMAKFLGSAVPETLPPKPKRPCSSFSSYWPSVWKDLKKQNPGVRPADMMKVLAQKWNQLTETEKQSYSKNYETERLNYVKQMGKYCGISLTPEQVKQVLAERKLMRCKRTILAVQRLAVTKRPTNSYGQYYRENFPKGIKPNEFGDACKQLAQKWKTLSEQEKEPYVKAYQAEKEAYEKLHQEKPQMGQQDVGRVDTPKTVPAKRKSK